MFVGGRTRHKEGNELPSRASRPSIDQVAGSVIFRPKKGSFQRFDNFGQKQEGSDKTRYDGEREEIERIARQIAEVSPTASAP